jgi:hypothetical protein
MIRCDECKKTIVPITKYQDWVKVVNFIDLLYMEKYIEQETRDEMLDAMMSLKAFAYTDDWDVEPVKGKKK